MQESCERIIKLVEHNIRVEGKFIENFSQTLEGQKNIPLHEMECTPKRQTAAKK